MTARSFATTLATLFPRACVLVSMLFSVASVAACAKKSPPPVSTSSTAEVDASADPPEPPASPAYTGPIYPAPFTAEQIRAATKAGRTYRYLVEMPGKPPKERVLTFTRVDEAGAEIVSGGGTPKRLGWPTLQKHAEFPKDKVSTHKETVKLPGGKFDCIVYEVVGKDGEVSTYYFAKSLPGAPVLFYSEQDGQRVRTTTLLQHIQGSGS